MRGLTQTKPWLAAALACWLLLPGCGSASSRADEKLTQTLSACNGSPALCGKSLKEITLLGSHNSFSNAAEGWQAPNQRVGLTQQLEGGVRYMALDVYADKGEVVLCHTYCHLGRETLLGGLGKIADFMKKNPREVLILSFESYVSGADMKKVFEAAGLLNQLHVQTPGQPWPTLAQMIGAGRRLVVFTSRDGGAFAGFHSGGDFMRFNGWGFKSLEEQNCGNEGGAAPLGQHQLYGLNHQYVNAFGIPTQSHAAIANARQAILDHVTRCQTQMGQRPNVVELDFFDTGDGWAAVRELNGLDTVR